MIYAPNVGPGSAGIQRYLRQGVNGQVPLMCGHGSPDSAGTAFYGTAQAIYYNLSGTAGIETYQLVNGDFNRFGAA